MSNTGNFTSLGYSPLHEACKKGDLELVKQLLAAGADPKRQTLYMGFYPVDFAYGMGFYDIIEYMQTNYPVISKHYKLDKNGEVDLKQPADMYTSEMTISL